mgnify:FL=1
MGETKKTKTGFIEGVARLQATLFPELLDDYINKESSIRVIDLFVDNLDLAKLEYKTTPAKTGRPGYHPSTMLKLFIYGYLNRIQSSRRLERESGRNVELMWLLGRLAPDFKTIADFRKDNGKGIKNTCRTFIGICRQLNMFTDAIVAIDGSKFKAVNSKKNNYTPQKLKFHIERVEKHIDEYLKQMEAADSAEDQIVDDRSIEDKITGLKQKLSELKALEVKVNEDPGKQLSTTDPDSRLLKTQGMTRAVCYNVQTAVDTKNHLIVAHEVINTTDRGQLCRVGKQAQAALDNKGVTVIADKGYFSGPDIKATQDSIDQMNELMETQPDSMLVRKQTVEHPYGTIKCWMGATHFLTKRFKNVNTEMNLHVLAYNLKRMMSIFGEAELVAAMTEL